MKILIFELIRRNVTDEILNITKWKLSLTAQKTA